MWVFIGLFSAIFLGLYDIFRKIALKENAVIPVLFFACITGALIFLPFIILSFTGHILADSFFYIPLVDARVHVFIFIKSALVGTSWFLAYYAISNLPLTIVIPIRATGPTWTIIGALLIFGERFSIIQWTGILVVLIFFYIFSLAGKKEGIIFSKNKWVFAVIGATLLGATSSLYDKFLFSHFDRMAIQAWFSIYTIPVFIPFMAFIWFPRRNNTPKFRWSPYIHLIGIVLIVSDFLYFYALSEKGSLIAVLSVLRRSSVVISFVAGALIFGEGNLRRKTFALIGILAGIILIVLGTI